MELTPLATDNISDLLVKIVEFTRLREEVLERNIDGARRDGFIPRDLPVEEFCEALDCAVVEHVKSKRLVLCDTPNLTFGSQGRVYVRAVIDLAAQQVLARDIDQFVELQREKLVENTLNSRLALELLGMKEGFVSTPVHCIMHGSVAVQRHPVQCWDETPDSCRHIDS